MSDHLKATIADLEEKLRDQQATVVKTKSLINQLAEMAGMAPIYAESELATKTGVNLSIRADQFYGQPQATCVREILDMRKALNRGPATINEIFDALKEGGFAFDTKNDENAKRGLRISISKNTALFHKLPNGKVGLLEWYPSAKKGGKKAAGSGGGSEQTTGAASADADSGFDDGFGDDDDGSTGNAEEAPT